MDGFINVYKPRGWTSHDMVGKLRGILGIKKIGHTGTLDPQVDGVLLVACGKATRLIQFLSEQDKHYDGQIVFGISTDTEDMTGIELERQGVAASDLREFAEVLLSFTGEIMQIPPMVSAVQVDGKRLYQLAREGKTVDRPARPVIIHETRLLREPYLDSDGFWKSDFHIHCSRGTYVRTYCTDLGKQLNLPAVLGNLTRVAVGNHTIEDAWTWEMIREEIINANFSFLIPPEKEMIRLDGMLVPSDLVSKVCHGVSIDTNQCRWTKSPVQDSDQPLALFDQKGSFLAVGERRIEGHKDYIKMRKVFCN